MDLFIPVKVFTEHAGNWSNLPHIGGRSPMIKMEGTPVLNKCIGFSSKKQNCSEIQNKELILKI